MTGFEPRTSRIGSNSSTNWATTTTTEIGSSLITQFQIVLPDLMMSLRSTCGIGSALTCQGKWLRLSWQSSRFQHQSSAVRILSPAKFLLNIVNCQLYWKEENKEKEAGNGPFLKKTCGVKLWFLSCVFRGSIRIF